MSSKYPQSVKGRATSLVFDQLDDDDGPSMRRSARRLRSWVFP